MLVEHPEDMAEIEKKIEAEEAAKSSKRKRECSRFRCHRQIKANDEEGRFILGVSC